MNTENKVKPREPYSYDSFLNIHGSKIRIEIQIQSVHNKAYRRMILQSFAKAIRQEMKFMNRYSINHSDAHPIQTFHSIFRNWSYRQGILIDRTERERGFLIREKRTSLGMTQKIFAKTLGIDRTYLSKIEHGKKTPSIKLLKAIHDLKALAKIQIKRRPIRYDIRQFPENPHYNNSIH